MVGYHLQLVTVAVSEDTVCDGIKMCILLL